LHYYFVNQQRETIMKKIILSFAAAAMLAGCGSSHTHYSKEERYTQNGHDCIVEINEQGIANRVNADKKSNVVHSNTACAELTKKPIPAQTQFAAPAPAANIVYLVPVQTPTRTIRRVYLRSNCRASYGNWC
jgi:hypothetical protein